MEEIIIIMKSRTYMTVKHMAEWYERTEQTIRRDVKAMKETGRYNPKSLVLDDEGKWLINTLMYEDYLGHKTELKNRNLARRLAPYDPAETRWQRGEHKAKVICEAFQDGGTNSGQDKEEVKDIVKEVLREAIGA